MYIDGVDYDSFEDQYANYENSSPSNHPYQRPKVSRDQSRLVYDVTVDKAYKGLFHDVHRTETLVIQGYGSIVTPHFQVISILEAVPVPPFRWLLLRPIQEKKEEYNIVGFAYRTTSAMSRYTGEIHAISIHRVMRDLNGRPRFFIEGVENCYNEKTTQK